MDHLKSKILVIKFFRVSNLSTSNWRLGCTVGIPGGGSETTYEDTTPGAMERSSCKLKTYLHQSFVQVF